MKTHSAPASISLRVVAYLIVATAGYFTLSFTSRAVDRVAQPWMGQVWGWFLLVGGLVCVIGLLFRSWIGELIGLPLIGASNMFYGTVVLLSYRYIPDGAFLFVGSFYWAFGLLVTERWLRAYWTARNMPPIPGGHDE